MMDTSGVWSHWSAPVQFTTSSPANTPMLVAHLRVTEVMYNPPPATLAEQAAGFTDQDFEYIELFNTGTQPLNLSGVHFTTGLDFDFTSGSVTSLAPGGYVVVGRNRAALEMRYGAGVPIAGEFTGDTGLANGGETIGLADVGDTPILEFTFDDTAETWHPSTDGEGPSLVILDPAGAVANWSDGPAWRPSHELAGSPGEKDLLLGDMDQNDRVDLRDLAILQSNLGTTSGATRLSGDLTRDGAVTREDLARFVSAYGRSFAPPAGPAPAADAAIARQVTARTESQRTNLRSTPLRQAVDVAISSWSNSDSGANDANSRPAVLRSSRTPRRPSPQQNQSAEPI